MRNTLRIVMMTLAFALCAVAARSVHAQVTISMPPPPPKAEKVSKAAIDEAPPAMVKTGDAEATMIGDVPEVAIEDEHEYTEGELALARYAQVRTGTYDTYLNDGSFYNNNRFNSYQNWFPQFWWGPTWGGGGWCGWGGGGKGGCGGRSSCGSGPKVCK